MTNEADKPGVRGFFKRLRAKLNQGPAWLTTDIAELLPGRKIDAEILDELETRLITADVGIEATGRILDDLRKRVARKELDDVDALLKALHRGHGRHLEAGANGRSSSTRRIKPYVILVVGINGAGKTTTIGKLAHRLLAEGSSVMLAAGDTFRAAAREQLEVWAERNNVPIIAQQAGAEPAAVIFDALQAARARNIDVLIADTAGRLHTQAHLMEELKKVKRVLARLDPSAPHEVLLVLDGTIGQNAVAQAEEFNKGLGVTGLVVTKLDGTAKGGVVLAIAQKLKIPIRFIGVGEQTEDFGVFNASEFVSALLKVGSRRRRRMIRFDQVLKRYPNGREALAGVSFNDRRRRAGIFDGPFRRRQEQHLETDRAHRAPDARPGVRQQSKHRRRSSRAAFRSFAASSAWCFRITSCCTTGRWRTTSRCR